MFDIEQYKGTIMKVFTWIFTWFQNRKNSKDKVKKKEVSEQGYEKSVLIPVTKKKKTKAERIRNLALEYQYDDDPLFKARYYSKKHFKKYIAVIHFSWTRSLNSLSSYFSKSIKRRANSTWGIGKDGTAHRYLPSVLHPAWTQGVGLRGKGGFIDYRGDWVKNVNNVACSFEVDNINYKPYTTKQYEAVAVRILWMLEYFEHFRIWFTTGHEQIIPFVKSDPGKHWNWEKFFIEFCGVKKKFYNEYLIYLAETSSYSTVGDKDRSDRKLAEIYEGINKIRRFLLDKPKDFCFK